MIIKSLQANNLLETRNNSDLTEEELISIMESYEEKIDSIIGKSYTWKDFFETGNGATVSREAVEIFYNMFNVNENDSIFSTDQAVDQSYIFTHNESITRTGTYQQNKNLNPIDIIGNPNLTVCEKEAYLDVLTFVPSNKTLSKAQMELEQACFRLYQSSIKMAQMYYTVGVAASLAFGICTGGISGIIGGLAASADYMLSVYYESIRYENCKNGRGYNL